MARNNSSAQQSLFSDDVPAESKPPAGRPASLLHLALAAEPEPMSPQHARNFLFAGKAIFTLVSRKSGSRFTYRIKQTKDEKAFYVSVLGDDNRYQYAGMVWITDLTRFVSTQKSRVGAGAPSAQAIKWYLKNVGSPWAELYHEGKCGRCGRALTVPSSIEAGLGPVCAGL